MNRKTQGIASEAFVSLGYALLGLVISLLPALLASFLVSMAVFIPAIAMLGR